MARYYMSFAHTYLTNMFLLYFIVLLLNIHNGKQPLLLPFILIIVSMMALSWPITRYFRLRTIYILLPFVAAAAFYFDFHWLSALLIAYLPVLRMEYLYDDIDDTMASHTLIAVFLLLLAVNMFRTDAMMEHFMLLHAIFIVLLLFHFLGRTVVLLVGNSYDLRRNIITSLTVSGIFITLGVMMATAYHYVVFAGRYILVILLNGLVLLLKPFFSFLENIEFELPERPVEESMEQNGEDERILIEQGGSAVSELPVGAIMTAVLIILSILGLVYYYRNRRAPAHMDGSAGGSHPAPVIDDDPERRLENIPVPDNRIRKIYFNFEKWLGSKGVGRYRSETIDEWLGRTGLGDIVDNEKLEIYRRTRYTDRPVTDSEYRRYKDSVVRMKKEISEHLKREG